MASRRYRAPPGALAGRMKNAFWPVFIFIFRGYCKHNPHHLGEPWPCRPPGCSRADRRADRGGVGLYDLHGVGDGEYAPGGHVDAAARGRASVGGLRLCDAVCDVVADDVCDDAAVGDATRAAVRTGAAKAQRHAGHRADLCVARGLSRCVERVQRGDHAGAMAVAPARAAGPDDGQPQLPVERCGFADCRRVSMDAVERRVPALLPHADEFSARFLARGHARRACDGVAPRRLLCAMLLGADARDVCRWRDEHAVDGAHRAVRAV